MEKPTQQEITMTLYDKINQLMDSAPGTSHDKDDQELEFGSVKLNRNHEGRVTIVIDDEDDYYEGEGRIWSQATIDKSGKITELFMTVEGPEAGKFTREIRGRRRGGFLMQLLTSLEEENMAADLTDGTPDASTTETV